MGLGLELLWSTFSDRERRESKVCLTQYLEYTFYHCYPLDTGNRTQRCMVSNPIYEGSDGFYEELPDCLPSSEPFSAKASASIPPNIPQMRKMDPQEMKNISESEKGAMECKLDRAPPSSLDNHSLSSQHGETEDCYTVMSPAGTLTVLPRNRHSAGSQLGGNFPWPMGGTL